MDFSALEIALFLILVGVLVYSTFFNDKIVHVEPNDFNTDIGILLAIIKGYRSEDKSLYGGQEKLDALAVHVMGIIWEKYEFGTIDLKYMGNLEVTKDA